MLVTLSRIMFLASTGWSDGNVYFPGEMVVYGPLCTDYMEMITNKGDNKQPVDTNKDHCTEGVFGLEPEAKFKLKSLFLFYRNA